MAKLVGELLFVMIRALVQRWAYASWLKVGTWLDRKIPGRRMKLVVGGLLGLAAYVLAPVLAGLIGL